MAERLIDQLRTGAASGKSVPFSRLFAKCRLQIYRMSVGFPSRVSEMKLNLPLKVARIKAPFMALLESPYPIARGHSGDARIGNV